MATWLSNRVKQSASLSKVPMMDYGKAQMTDYSYSVGALMFYTLYRLMGHQAFTKLIATAYQRHKKTSVSNDDFVRLANELSPVPLSAVFRDWLYSTRWSEIVATTPGHELPDRYHAATAGG